MISQAQHRPALKMSTILKESYLPAVQTYITSFENISCGYTKLGSELEKKKEQIIIECEKGKLSKQTTDQVTAHLSSLATRIDDKSLAFKTLLKKVSELKELQLIFKLENGKIRLEQCVYEVEQAEKPKEKYFKNERVYNFLEVYVSGKKEQREIQKQERYLNEFKEDLQKVCDRCLNLVRQLASIQEKEDRQLSELFRQDSQQQSASCIAAVGQNTKGRQQYNDAVEIPRAQFSENPQNPPKKPLNIRIKAQTPISN